MSALRPLRRFLREKLENKNSIKPKKLRDMSFLSNDQNKKTFSII